MKMGVNFFLNTIYNACASSIDNFLNVIFIFMTLMSIGSICMYRYLRRKEKEGAEVIIPEFMGFIKYVLANETKKNQYL